MAEAADPLALERVGTVIGDKWTLERLLGEGGMGAVYAARHRNGARAAIKLLHADLARNDHVRERFRREAYAANSVEHRATVKVLDDDEIKDGPDAGAAYLVMELLEGESLDDRTQREPRLDERELLEVMDVVLDVLVAAHAKGIVHRDLKPENLFFANDPDGGKAKLKVLDFGLARIAEASRVTGHGLALGTPSFMAPEQAAGLTDQMDGRVDIFSLAATVFFCLTGRHLHDADTVLQQIVKMAKDPPPKLKTVAPDASDDFAAIIDHALERDLEQRYATASDMHADVKAALARRAPPPSTTVEVMSPSSIRPSAPMTSVAPSAPPEQVRGGSGCGLVSLVAFGALAVGGLFAWSQQGWIRARIGAEGAFTSSVPPASASTETTDEGLDAAAMSLDPSLDGALGVENDAGILELGGPVDAGADAEADDDDDDDDLDGGIDGGELMSSHAAGGAHPLVRPKPKKPARKPGTAKPGTKRPSSKPHKKK